MPAAVPVAHIDPPKSSDQASRLTSAFSVGMVSSGLACYSLTGYIVPAIEAAGLDGLVVYVLLFLGGLLGLMVSLAPLMKPALIEAHSEPIDG